MVTRTVFVNGSVFSSQHVFEQLLGADQSSVGDGQALEDGELLRVSSAASRRGWRGAARIDDQVAALHHRGRAGSASPQCADSRHQLGERERLAEVVVRAELQPVDPILTWPTR